MALQGVKALLFDVFGTVVDWQGSVANELKERNEQLGEGNKPCTLQTPCLYSSNSLFVQLIGLRLQKSGAKAIMKRRT